MSDDAPSGPTPVDPLPLVGSRNDNQIRRVRDRLAGTYVEAGTFHGEALAQHGLPPDYWLPFELAILWKSNDYPRHQTRESYEQWEVLQREVVGLQRLANFRAGLAEEMLADWEHDRELIAKFDRTLAGGQLSTADNVPPPAPPESPEPPEPTHAPDSIAELLEWCQRQLLWLENYVGEHRLGPASQDNACHRLGRSAFQYAESFGPPELLKKLHRPPWQPPLLTCGQSNHNLRTLAEWCEEELRHLEARGLLDAQQPRSLAEFKNWCVECVAVLRQQPQQEASFFAREAVQLAAVFCAGLGLPSLQAVCVTVYPMLPPRAIRILDACALACEREDISAQRAESSNRQGQAIDLTQVERQFEAKLEASRRREEKVNDSAGAAEAAAEGDDPLEQVKRALDSKQEARYFGMLYEAGFTEEEVGRPGGLPFVGPMISADDPRYPALEEAKAENLRMEAAKIELLRELRGEPPQSSQTLSDDTIEKSHGERQHDGQLTVPDNTAPSCAHSIDFRSVRWHGVTHSFTKTQAACIKILWEHWERGTPDVGEQTILEVVESSQVRLASVFDNGKHDAWGKMVVPGSTKGTFRLSDQPPTENPTAKPTRGPTGTP